MVDFKGWNGGAGAREEYHFWFCGVANARLDVNGLVMMRGNYIAKSQIHSANEDWR